MSYLSINSSILSGICFYKILQVLITFLTKVQAKKHQSLHDFLAEN